MKESSYAAALAKWHRQLREAHRHRALERKQVEAEETQRNEVAHNVESHFPPRTGFRCQHMVHPGYYADIEEQCEVFHVCTPSNGQISFYCPQHTRFNQKYLTCDWSENVQCSLSPYYYYHNSHYWHRQFR
ncbi:unnamed protein product [Darwinula stevensoni]|uniref:Chitin-binding type-2 domain-containing protein n=1 Tax=Darwinula stevensoni TaxID=69355 RepID=A0A7R9A2W2_9CRUS|nr:unnamed protein product [Darwinula stevensoni]CAG0880765.1 unnamed protein product [Darwinula stevensoni]